MKIPRISKMIAKILERVGSHIVELEDVDVGVVVDGLTNVIDKIVLQFSSFLVRFS